jgi:hypothetical protein
MDIATGYLEIGGLLDLDQSWQKLEKIRIILEHIKDIPGFEYDLGEYSASPRRFSAYLVTSQSISQFAGMTSSHSQLGNHTSSHTGRMMLYIRYCFFISHYPRQLRFYRL